MFKNLFKHKDSSSSESGDLLVEEWIEQGKKLIFPEKYDDWENYVRRVCNDKYFGLEVAGVLRIMMELETGAPIPSVLENISKDSIACEYKRSNLRNRVFEFSKRGPEFLEAVLDKDSLTLDLVEKINEKKNENMLLLQKYKN